MKLKLSDRMQAIADHVNPEDVVADIGTDHGYIPIWLTLNKKCKYAILADINKGPLKKAAESIKKYAADEKYDIRLGNGIEVLSYGEVDTIIIAGMGGILIKNILAADIQKTKLFKKMILQPRNNSEILRQWLNNLEGFQITCEEVIKEIDKFSEIITVTAVEYVSEEEKDIIVASDKMKQIMEIPEDFYLDIPVLYLSFVNDTVIEYLNKRLSVAEYIADSIRNKGQVNTVSQQLEDAETKVRYIRRFLKEAENVKG